MRSFSRAAAAEDEEDIDHAKKIRREISLFMEQQRAMK